MLAGRKGKCTALKRRYACFLYGLYYTKIAALPVSKNKSLMG